VSLHVYQANRSAAEGYVFAQLLQQNTHGAASITQGNHTLTGLGTNGASVSEGNKFAVFAEVRSDLLNAVYQDSFTRLGAVQFTRQQSDTVSATAVSYIAGFGFFELSLAALDGDGDIEQIATLSITQDDNTISARAVETGEAVVSIIQEDQTVSAAGTAEQVAGWTRVTPSDSTWTTVTPSDSTWTTV
jgi:hypothetical protein